MGWLLRHRQIPYLNCFRFMFTAPWLRSVFFLDRTPTKKTSTMKSRDNSPSGGGLNEWKKTQQILRKINPIWSACLCSRWKKRNKRQRAKTKGRRQRWCVSQHAFAYILEIESDVNIQHNNKNILGTFFYYTFLGYSCRDTTHDGFMQHHIKWWHFSKLAHIK